jgi:ribonuclease BN (tRNA processing enzyme)
MHLRFLGCHHTETARTRLSSILVNGVVVFDAGAITSTLSAEEQNRIKAVLITHRHYDHIRDLPTFALGGVGTGSTVPVYATVETFEGIRKNLMDGIMYPDFAEIPSPDKPRLNNVEVKPWEKFEVGGLVCTPVPMTHAVPAVGYRVAPVAGGRSFFFTGDTVGGVDDVWTDIRADLLIIEVTFPNAMAEFAEFTRHMTPATLERQLTNIRASGLAVPPVIAVHMNERAEQDIAAELREVEHRTGTSITPAYEGMLVEV